MSISALNVTFDADTFAVELSDGRTLRVPLVWFPRLLHATSQQRSQFEISQRGLHWGELDEDISVDGLLAGHADATNLRQLVA